MAVSAEAGRALRISLGSAPGVRLKTLLEDAAVPKTVHDLKATLRSLENHGIAIANVRDDLMLYSYLINPTHAAHRLADVVARFTNSPLSETGDRQLPEQAAAIQALAATMRSDVEAMKALEIYKTIDMPLVPVLLGMERAGVRIDVNVLEWLSERSECRDVAGERADL